MRALAEAARWTEREALPDETDLPKVLVGLEREVGTVAQSGSPTFARRQLRGHLQPALSDARLDRPVLRRRADGPGRRPHRVVPHPGRLSRSPGDRGNAGPAAGARPRHPRGRLGLLRPQRCRRCRGRCRADRQQAARPAGARAVDARTGARVGAVRPGHADEGARLARQWPDRQLGLRCVEQHPQYPARRRCRAARGAVQGQPGGGEAGQDGDNAGGQWRPQLHSALRHPEQEHPLAFPPRHAAARLGAARRSAPMPMCSPSRAAWTSSP